MSESIRPSIRLPEAERLAHILLWAADMLDVNVNDMDEARASDWGPDWTAEDEEIYQNAKADAVLASKWGHRFLEHLDKALT